MFTITNQKGAYFSNCYPKILDFQNTSSITVLYEYNTYDTHPNFRINPLSEDLDCQYLDGLTKCLVPISHFNYEESGYFNTYYTDSKGGLSIFYDLSPFKVILPKRNILKLKIQEKDNQDTIKLGQEGTIYFKTNYNDDEENIFDPEDIEEKTEFESKIFDGEENTFDVKCRLWKSKGQKVMVLCKLDTYLDKVNNNIYLDVVKLTYKEYNISIVSETKVKVEQLNYKIPFIYSDIQNVNITEERKIYELRFKYDSFNNDILFLHGSGMFDYIILDNCETSNNELICEVPKEKLEEVLKYNDEPFTLGTINDNYGQLTFDFVFDINIFYEITEKIDIYVNITKLLENVTEQGSTFAYETSVDDIEKLNTKIFKLEFAKGDQDCYFKKSNNNNNLLLICVPRLLGEIYLGRINETILDEIHYKYNFIINSVENDEIIYVDNYGIPFGLAYPEILNFTTEYTMTIRYLMNNPFYLESIKLNPDSPYNLDCEDLNNMKKCNVPLTHFKNKESGNYNTYHINHKRQYSINYEINPINVILPPNENVIEIGLEDDYNRNTIYIGKEGTLYFTTSFIDTEDIFDVSDIEEVTKFETTITDKDKNKYKAFCRLWKPINDNLRIFCNLNESFSKETLYIDIESASFEYKNYTIIIISYLTRCNVEQLDKYIPFLYSDTQLIKIEDVKEVYELKFKIEKYNKERLILVGQGLNAIVIDQCQIFDKELICNVKKEKLEEYLGQNMEIYRLIAFVESFGIFSLNNILGIVIENNITIKENIYIEITKLLKNNYRRRDYITYETNVTDISNIHSFPFNIDFNSSSLGCIFKKTDDKPLLLLCEARNEGEDYLSDIKEEKIIYSSHIKYNFIVLPVSNHEVFTVKDRGTLIAAHYPDILDFSLNNTLYIEYYVEQPDLIYGMKLNPDSIDYLECKKDSQLIQCSISPNHFMAKHSGYYYNYHSYNLGESSIDYFQP